MNLSKLKPDHLLLPLMILACIGLAIPILQPIFNVTTRWVIIIAMLLYLSIKKHFLRNFRTDFDIITLLYVLWATATVIWSEMPLLSGMKGGTLILITFTSMAAGHYWVNRHAFKDALNYLLPLTVVVLLAGLLGRFSTDSVVDSGSTIMYQGLAGGPNMFGSMLAMCSPFLIWQTYSHWKNLRKRLFWILLMAIALYYLLAANSRGAILVVLFSMFGLFLSLGFSRKIHLTIITTGLITVGLILMPGKFEQIKQQFIYKNASQEEGVFHTRKEVWDISYEQAIKGGVWGGGYGVTIGDSNDFQGGFTSVGYGREKGNSQLAIIEEVGFIGFGIYILSLCILFYHLIKRVLRLPNSPEKALLSIVTGTLLGMVAHSIFEAWWVAPASPESIYFWTLTGVALALARLKSPIKQAANLKNISSHHHSTVKTSFET